MMTEMMYTALLDKAEAKKSKAGDAELPEGRTLTLYLSNKGVSMSVSKVVSLRLEREGIIEARDTKGELYLVALEDVFAGSIQGGSKSAPARKAGFLS